MSYGSGGSPTKQTLQQILANQQAALRGTGQPISGASGTLTANQPSHTSQPVTALNQVILPVLRRVMPSVIANQIIGTQSMSGPSGSIYSLRARYGYGTSPPWMNNCKSEDCSSCVFNHHVDFPIPSDDQTIEVYRAMPVWAIQNVRHPYGYQMFEHLIEVEGQPVETLKDTWRWYFMDADEAFHFKIRWYGASSIEM